MAQAQARAPMSFRKRNVGLSGSSRGVDAAPPVPKEKIQLPGVRPSAIDGRPTTSTGTATLDGLLAGHAGLALGTSILIEESGTTDYAGALLRFYAAEGLVQGHHVHVIGLPEQWGRELPGLIGDSDGGEKKRGTSEKMKIAWRYERLGQFGADVAARDRAPAPAPVLPSSTPTGATDTASPAFCHMFDLTKRLVHPPGAQISFLLLSPNPSQSPFDPVVGKLVHDIAAAPPNTVHRIIVPSLLSPALYPPHACQPQHVLKFQHSLKAIIASSQGRTTLMQSLPLSLYPRSSGLVKWIELLNDGVLELAPFPHSADTESQASRDPSTKEEPPQGMLQIHKIPLYHDRASGTVSSENDWTFTLSRRRFGIKPYNLPPIEGDTEAQQTAASGGEEKAKKADLEF